MRGRWLAHVNSFAAALLEEPALIAGPGVPGHTPPNFSLLPPRTFPTCNRQPVPQYSRVFARTGTREVEIEQSVFGQASMACRGKLKTEAVCTISFNL